MWRAHGGLWLGAVVAQVLLCAPAALAQQDAVESSARAPASATAGMYLPFTEAPRTDTQRAFATAVGGYDFARESTLLENRNEVTVYGPLALRLGVIYTERPEQLRPTGGARVQVASQADGDGIDVSIGAFYKPEGFTEGEGEIEGVLAFGRRFDDVGVFADLVYGQDPEARERDGELRIAALYSAAPRLELGLDSRLRFDLGSEEEKLQEEGGASYDLVAGPALSYAFDDVAVGAHGGVSVLGVDDTRVGAILLGSMGGSF